MGSDPELTSLSYNGAMETRPYALPPITHQAESPSRVTKSAHLAGRCVL